MVSPGEATGLTAKTISTLNGKESGAELKKRTLCKFICTGAAFFSVIGKCPCGKTFFLK